MLKHIEEEPETEEVVKTDQVEDNGAIAYIDTLEKFAHESGVNLDALRGHFGLEKAYLQEGSGGYSHRGQGDMKVAVNPHLNQVTHLCHPLAAIRMLSSKQAV